MSAFTHLSFSRLLGWLLAVLLLVSAGLVSAPPAHAEDTSGSLSGTVTDEGARPVGNVGVAVYSYDSVYQYWAYRGNAWTSDDGTYTIGGLAAGAYKVEFTTQGASANVVGEWWDDAASQAAATVVEVSAGSVESGISPRLAAAGGLSGTVTDGAGHPVGSVEITVYGYDTLNRYWTYRAYAYTSEDGTYAVERLAAGDYKVQFSTQNASASVVGEWWNDAASESQADVVTVSAGSTKSGISPRLAAGAGLSGTVTDVAGHPVGSVEVSVLSYDPVNRYWMSRAYASTSKDGTYAIERLAAGDYKVQFTTQGASANVVGEWWDDAATESQAEVVTLSAGSTKSGISPRLAAGGGLSGTVTDEHGDPVRSVGVSVLSYDPVNRYWTSRGYASTSEDGTYLVGGLMAGDYKVQFMTQNASANVVGEWWDDAATQDAATVVNVSAGSTKSGISPRLAEGGGLSGTVTDEGGNPVGSVGVTVYSYDTVNQYWAYRGNAWTSEDGTYAVGGLAAGDYKVQFTTQGASANVVGEWWDDAATQDAATAVNVSAGSTRSGISPRLAAGGAISGTVTDERGDPVGNVDVGVYSYDKVHKYWMWAAYTSTAADGTYTVRGLAARDYKVQFMTVNASASVVGEWWDDAATESQATVVPVSAGSTKSGISPRLAAGGVIAGTVTDERGDPVGNVGVGVYFYDPVNKYWNWAANTSSAADGTYTVRGLAARDYKVQFTTEHASANVVAEWWDSAANEGSATVVPVASGSTVSGISPRLETGGTISGTVTDQQGVPASGISVRVSSFDEPLGGSSFWASSGEDGKYSVRGLPADDYLVRFEGTEAVVGEWWDDARSQTDAKVITVSAGSAVADVSPELSPAGAVAGVVTDEGGKPISGVEVRVAPVGSAPFEGGERGGQTGADGSYEVRGLSAGDYTVYFATGGASASVLDEWWDDANSKASSAPVAVVEGSTTSGISPRLAAGGEISGTVHDGNGDPLQYFAVHAYLGDEPAASSLAQTSADGSFTIRGLREGGYRLRFTATDDSGTGLVEWWNDAADRASALPVAVTVGGSVDDIDIVLSENDGSVIDTRSGSLSGTVTDELGRPIPNAIVSIMDASGRSGDGTGTDASGNWSASNLDSRDYRIAFQASLGGEIVTQYWNEASSFEDSTVIALSPGEQRTGISATLHTPSVLETAVPSISGIARVGSTLAVNPGPWTEGTDFGYQWLADEVPIAGATSASLVLSAAEIGKSISVIVRGSKDGYQSAVMTALPTAVVTGGTLTSATPTISGTLGLGSTLTAKPGTWTTGTTLKYQWYAGGVAIVGAASSTFKLTSTQKDKQISVKVTGSKAGYATVAKTSALSLKVATVATPTISGTVAVGSTLTAKPGTWTASTAFKYQWYAGGAAIVGAASSTFKLTSTQKDKQISVKVTGSKAGYATVAKTSALSLKVATVATPTISGTVAVGSTLTAKPGTWTASTAFKYQWYAGGAAIVGAASSTFKLTSTQKDKQISVKVTGSKAGYATVAKTSALSLKVATVSTPKITGVVRSGAALTASPGSWTASTTFKYQWYAGGVAISGATASTFKLTATQVGKAITVKVTGSKAGYPTVAKTSAATALVAAA